MASTEMTGSESLAKGIMDGGAKFAASYPGGPTTGVVQKLIDQGGAHDIYVEWASNEKVAFEEAFGCCLTGARSVMVAKHVGINHIMDPLMTANLTGSGGGMLILAGDDPGAYGSQNEQDSRILGAMAEIPILEPATPAQGYQMVRCGFRLSEILRLPVMIRFTTDYTLQKGAVTAETPHKPVEPAFVDHKSFKQVPSNAVENHVRLHAKMRQSIQLFEQDPYDRFNPVSGDGTLGLLACGQVAAALDRLGSPASVRCMSLGTISPLPEQSLLIFLKPLKRLYVLEDGEPFMEIRVRDLAQKNGLALEILGKTGGQVPWEGSLNEAALARFLTDQLEQPPAKTPAGQRQLPSRKPLGIDCPYEPFVMTLKELIADGKLDRPVVVGETGCLVKLNNPPYDMLDVKYSMGSSIGLACGLRRSGIKDKILALTGDSAFFHTGINGLITAAHHRTDIIVVVMDNRTVALTGFQTTIGTGQTASGERVPTFGPEDVAKALNIENVQVLDAYDRDAIAETLKKLWQQKGPALVVVRGACPYIDAKSCRIDTT
jgi:indolepyruvate ferredoxin oxidoreductase, alpha subunit